MDSFLDASAAADSAPEGAGPPMTAAEYSESVYQWLVQAHQWHTFVAGFPAFMAYQASALRASQQNTAGNATQIPSPGVATTSVGEVRVTAAPSAAESVAAALREALSRNTRLYWREFRIAPLWKRCVAEGIDFLILFLLKLAVTFVAVDYFELLDIDSLLLRHDKSSLLAATATGDLDLLTAMEATYDILLLETVHKLMVCVFETLCTHRGTRRSAGGATPGKLIMGIRIYHFSQIVSTAEQGVVQIVPASDLGLYRASIRSVVKNVASTFVFPSWLTIFLSPHYRAVHDVLSKTIVLELPHGDNLRGPAFNVEAAAAR